MTKEAVEMKKAAKWDTVEFLETEEDMVAYLNAALEEGNSELINVALGNIARAKGMTQLARETGITRDGLYKALSPQGNPSFDTILKVSKALGMKLSVSMPT
ncbi:addiction module antidote protein [Raoultibacter massiliensis]|uniref:Addiction module antidote protein n=1 Tax=Raoultibacter massiliensis TaxID=1852371 RepID=A0ABV1JEQ0_9ACTN|nr:addiction module antidote protein [Raoultibacter massiliensis]